MHIHRIGKPCLLCEYAHAEINIMERIVVKNEYFVALVPWWATWPFEILRELQVFWCLLFLTAMALVLPYKRHIPSLAHLNDAEKHAFAEILSNITKRYDNLFQCSFAYSMGIHQRPIPHLNDLAVDDDEDNVAHLHLHFAPPLLRSATVKKFLVG